MGNQAEALELAKRKAQVISVLERGSDQGRRLAMVRGQAEEKFMHAAEAMKPEDIREFYVQMAAYWEGMASIALFNPIAGPEYMNGFMERALRELHCSFGVASADSPNRLILIDDLHRGWQAAGISLVVRNLHQQGGQSSKVAEQLVGFMPWGYQQAEMDRSAQLEPAYRAALGVVGVTVQLPEGVK